MKFVQLMMAAVAVAFLVGCGGAAPEKQVAPEKAEVVEPTPVFEDDFEAGQVEGWTEGDEAQGEDEGSEAAPTE